MNEIRSQEAPLAPKQPEMAVFGFLKTKRRCLTCGKFIEPSRYASATLRLASFNKIQDKLLTKREPKRSVLSLPKDKAGEIGKESPVFLLVEPLLGGSISFLEFFNAFEMVFIGKRIDFLYI